MSSYNKTKGSAPVPVEIRLERKRNVTKNGCWEFTGYKNKDNYGTIGVLGEVKLVHRVSYELYVGPIPEGLFVCHHCDNPPCFNPDHLFLGTAKDNMQDMSSKGRAGVKYGKDNPYSKLNEKQIEEIRRLHIPIHRGGRGSNTAELAQKYGVSRQYIGRIVQRVWRNNG